VRWHFIEHLPKSIESPSRGSHAFQLQRCVVQSVSNKYVEHSLKLNGTSEQIHMLAHTHTHTRRTDYSTWTTTVVGKSTQLISQLQMSPCVCSTSSCVRAK